MKNQKYVQNDVSQWNKTMFSKLLYIIYSFLFQMKVYGQKNWTGFASQWPCSLIIALIIHITDQRLMVNHGK